MRIVESRSWAVLACRLVLGILLTLCAVGCGDKTMTTQPLTPTPVPTQAPSSVSMSVTLSRSDPPAGVKHAARATVVVRETAGRAVQLKSMQSFSYFGDILIQVAGFVPVALGAGQTVSFTVTLDANGDIPCSEGVEFTIDVDGQKPAFTFVGCEGADWPFMDSSLGSTGVTAQSR